MRPASGTVAVLIALSWCVSVVAQPAPYNTSDTFQPGKKYNCVPTADRNGWNCNEIGKAEPAQRAASDQPPAPPPAPVKSMPTAPPATTIAAPASIPSSSVPMTSTDRSSRLPSYLTNESATAPATATAPPSTISATANHANAPPVPMEAKQATPIKPPPAAKPAHGVAARTALPAPALPPREAAHATTAASDDFMALPGDHFVVELAHASKRSDLAASRDAMHIPSGAFYDVHFRQNGGDAWLLVWGSFDTIDAARSARSELARSTSAVIGFPRRVAPLQAEARRASE